MREIEDAELIQESLTPACLGNGQQTFVVGAHRWKIKKDIWWGHTVTILKYLSVAACFLWQQEDFSEFE